MASQQCSLCDVISTYITVGLNDHLGLQNELAKLTIKFNQPINDSDERSKSVILGSYMVSLASSFHEPKSSFKPSVLLILFFGL